MTKVLFKLIFIVFFISNTYGSIFPPYFFSMDPKNYPKLVDKKTLTEQVTLDNDFSKLKYIDNNTLTDKLLKKLLIIEI